MRRHPDFKAYLALISVCIFWGTTYLGIRMALESFPPFALVSIRFILSGSIMLAAAVWREQRCQPGAIWFQPAVVRAS